MKVIAYDPYLSPEAAASGDIRMVDLDTVLAESDFLSINCPLTDETRGMIGERELRKMKKTAFMINAARGAIVNETALIKALAEEWIKGAGLDVFEEEPVAVDNPLLKMDNVIVSPHFLCHTDQHFINLAYEWQEQVSDILSGKIPEKLVNREVWDSPRLQAKINRLRAE